MGGNDKASVYLEGDVAVYRASSVGNCVKELWAHRLGSFTPLPPPEAMQARFDDGHLHEGAVLHALSEKHGWAIEDSAQGEVELPVSSQVLIRGHVDGIGKGDTRRVIEIKALSQSMYDEWQSKGSTSWRDGSAPTTRI